MKEEKENLSSQSLEQRRRFVESQRFFRKLALGTTVLIGLWLISESRPDIAQFILRGVAGMGVLFTFYAWQQMRDDRY